MASAQVVETSVANNSPSKDSNHPDDHFQSMYATPGFKAFSYLCRIDIFQPGAVRYGYLKEATSVNEFMRKSDKPAWKAVTKEDQLFQLLAANRPRALRMRGHPFIKTIY